MDESPELKFLGTPQELARLEQSDLCTTLYTIWDTLRERGDMSGRHLYSCRNNSSVPDSAFGGFARTAIPDTETVVDRGEVFLLAPLPFDPFRERVAIMLSVALEAL